MSVLIWDYKVEKGEDDDDTNDDDSSEGTNEENEDNKRKDDDDACSPTMKRKYSPAVVSTLMDKSHGDNVSMNKLHPNLLCALG